MVVIPFQRISVIGHGNAPYPVLCLRLLQLWRVGRLPKARDFSCVQHSARRRLWVFYPNLCKSNLPRTRDYRTQSKWDIQPTIILLGGNYKKSLESCASNLFFNCRASECKAASIILTGDWNKEYAKEILWHASCSNARTRRKGDGDKHIEQRKRR